MMTSKRLHTPKETSTHTVYSMDGTKWMVNIPHNDIEHNAYFEHETMGEGGTLEIDHRMIVDFDGVYELPKGVCKILHAIGYKFAEFVLPDGLEL